MVTAAVVMLEAHLRGIAQMIVCPKEQAELYCEWLTATLEPAG